MLKFEGIKIGTRIRAYDFEPCPGRPDVFIEGVIIGIYDEEYKAYIVSCDYDETEYAYPEEDRYSRIGDSIRVPMEVSPTEYDGRIVEIKEGDFRYLCEWFPPFYKHEHDLVGRSHFTEDIGYDRDDRDRIYDLEVGHSVDLGLGDHKVTRIT